MHRPDRQWIALLVALAALAPASPIVAGRGDAVTHVHLSGVAFDPQAFSVDFGDTVEWHNHDDFLHTATADAGSWDTGDVPGLSTRTIEYTASGSFPYHCRYHRSFGMTGTLSVNEDPNEPPTVAITAPAAGSTVDGTVRIAGTAADPDGTVTKVEVRIDGGAWTDADGTTSWTLDWDTTTVANGARTIEARSSDGALASAIASRSVTVENPDLAPSIAIATPAEGATVEGLVAVTGTASDPENALSLVEVRIDGGAWNAASGLASWSFTWDATAAAPGAHSLVARATDAAGGTATATRDVTVRRNEPPTVAITAPADGAIVRGVVTIVGTAADADGAVASVSVRIDDGQWRSPAGTTSWSIAWDTTTATNGVHAIEAKSFDGSRESAVARRRVTVDNAPDLRLAAFETTEGVVSVGLSATVVNDGTIPSPASSVAFRATDGEGVTRQFATASLPALAPGESRTLTAAWSAIGRVGRFTLTAVADPADAVRELDETNNAAHRDVCGPPALGAIGCPAAGVDLQAALPA